MMKNDIQYSEKGIKLADEIIQIMRDNEMRSCIDDYPVLKEVMENNEFSDELTKKICDEQYIADSISSISFERKTESLSQFKGKLNFRVRQKERRKSILRYGLLTGITAAIAVLSFLLIDLTEVENREVIVHNSGKSSIVITVPTLISEDGEIISLSGDEISVNEKNIVTSLDTIPQDQTIRYNTIVVPNKFKFTVKLSDGSVVILNANSEMSYPSEFSGDMRNVKLKGEAYFMVSKSDKPFIVDTERGEVKVYGTCFNINLNRQDIMQVVLVEGSVGVTFREGNSDVEFMMLPSQLLEYNSKFCDKLFKENVNVDNYISWIDGSFRYNHIELHHLLQELSAWYGVKFEFSQLIGDTFISLNVNRDMELDTLLRILEKMCAVRFIKEKGGVYRIE